MSDNPDINAGSILDRVLQSQQSVALEHFEPVEVINELLKIVTAKEAEVLRRRFGLGQDEKETLEKIGQRFNVTRERVRQIERSAIVRIRQSPVTKSLLHDLDLLLQQLLEEHGGLMNESELYRALHSHATQTSQSQAAVEFLLTELMTDKVVRVDDPQWKPYWRLSFGDYHLLSQVIDEAAEVIRQYRQPLDRPSLLRQLRQLDVVKQHPELTETVLISYLNVATVIERNPFGEYGLSAWGSIVPKRMHDKILLVMRKHGQPMHFQEIAKKINELGFDNRRAYAPTVHNELILNPEYVLIGRGIYALREWGYQPGVVADVVAGILTTAGQPLNRDEIVKRVLEQRQVKRNTVHLALTDKNRFKKLADGKYTLVSLPVAVA